MTVGVVFDSSAVLAVLLDEPGRDRVHAKWDGGMISSVNLAEVVSRLVRAGMSGDQAVERVKLADLLVEDATRQDGEFAGRLWAATREFGLSLGDRFCLSVAARRNLPVLTADRVWAELDIGVDIEVIR